MDTLNDVSKQADLPAETFIGAQYLSSVSPDNGIIDENRLDEDDIFQCGRCKKQYTSFAEFLSHKKSHYKGGVLRSSTLFYPQPMMTKVLDTQQMLTKVLGVDEDRGCEMSDPIILSESDFLALTIDQGGLNIAQPTAEVSDVYEVKSKLATSVPNKILDGIIIASHEKGDLQYADQELLDPGLMSSECYEPKEGLASNVPNRILNGMVIASQDKAGIQYTTQDSLNFLSDSIVVENLDESTDMNSAVREVMVSVIEVDPTGSDSAGNNKEDSNRLRCSYCGKRFLKNCYLQQHYRCHTGERPFQCIICGRAFAQKSNVKKHMAAHKVWPKRSRTLPVINNDQDEKGEKEKNGETIPGPKIVPDSISSSSYSCQYCPLVFTSYYDWNSHRAKNHRNEMVFKCIQKGCEERFPEFDAFVDHTTSFHSEAEYCCHLCNEVFSSLDDLGFHQYMHNVKHNFITKAISCKQCKRLFSNTSSLNRHMVQHSHRHPCPHCSLVFPCERFLRRHLVTHSDCTPFSCTICKKEFKTRQRCAVHMLLHSSEKPYICKICSKSFKRRDLLARHRLIHEASNRFKCPFSAHGCVKAFSRKDKLKLHILTHDKSSSEVVCLRCDRKFKRNSQLKKHQKACFAQDNPCQDCGHVTASKDKKDISVSDVAKSVELKNKKGKTKLLPRYQSKRGSVSPQVSNLEEKKSGDTPTVEIVLVPLNKSADPVDGMYQVLFPGSSTPIDLSTSLSRVEELSTGTDWANSDR